MGLTYYGIHEEIATRVIHDYGLKEFVETGTWYGASSRWAANHFDHVYTVEISQKFYDDAIIKLSDIDNISCYFGDSVEMLPTMISELTKPALFWLDAHWDGAGGVIYDNWCPVVGEIKIINELMPIMELAHVIMVDDIRLMNGGKWAQINDILTLLSNDNVRDVILVDDVAVAVPR
jgi:hypothetical protein